MGENLTLPQKAIDRIKNLPISEEAKKGILGENLKREFGSFENAWIKACDEYFENSPCLEEKDKECIREIGKALGIANTQRQNDHVKSKIQKLQELEKMAMEKEEKEGKNAIKIALAISVAIIVILF